MLREVFLFMCLISISSCVIIDDFENQETYSYRYTNISGVAIKLERLENHIVVDSVFIPNRGSELLSTTTDKKVPLHGFAEEARARIKFMTDPHRCVEMQINISTQQEAPNSLIVHTKQGNNYSLEIGPEILSQATPEACVVE